LDKVPDLVEVTPQRLSDVMGEGGSCHTLGITSCPSYDPPIFSDVTQNSSDADFLANPSPSAASNRFTPCCTRPCARRLSGN
jgi:hypothetical protein